MSILLLAQAVVPTGILGKCIGCKCALVGGNRPQIVAPLVPEVVFGRPIGQVTGVSFAQGLTLAKLYLVG